MNPKKENNNPAMTFLLALKAIEKKGVPRVPKFLKMDILNRAELIIPQDNPLYCVSTAQIPICKNSKNPYIRDLDYEKLDLKTIQKCLPDIKTDIIVVFHNIEQANSFIKELDSLFFLEKIKNYFSKGKLIYAFTDAEDCNTFIKNKQSTITIDTWGYHPGKYADKSHFFMEIKMNHMGRYLCLHPYHFDKICKIQDGKIDMKLCLPDNVNELNTSVVETTDVNEQPKNFNITEVQFFEPKSNSNLAPDN